jgi:class 3 adenylate cyclase/pimeloyl-ACP methyl ester carboxylesterase
VRALPETLYAKSGDVHIAYQVLGEGPIDLVYSPSPVSNLEVSWEWPPFERFLRRLASFSRLILFDKRGTGLSDRVTDAATLEERMDDLRAVMDAARSERASIFGGSEGGPLALLFTATYPERVASLVLYGSYAKALNSDDYTNGVDREIFDLGMDVMEEEWGNCALIDVFTPSMTDNEPFRRWQGRWERQSASPGAAVAIQRLNAEIDVRAILPAIHVPTLILYRASEFVAHVEGSKYLAEHIPGAQYAEFEGVDFQPFVGDQDAIVDSIEAFLTGRPASIPVDRSLATLVFIDIVESTRQSRELGDKKWRSVLDMYDAIVDRHLAEYGGTHVKATGDGTLATFEGPSRAVLFALATRDALRDGGVNVRTGVHIGEIERRGLDVSGTAVNVAARVQAAAQPDEVLVSRTLADLLAGADIELRDAGEHDLKGVGSRQLFSAHRGRLP